MEKVSETDMRSPPGRMALVAAILMGGLGITQVVAMPLMAALIASALPPLCAFALSEGRSHTKC